MLVRTAMDRLLSRQELDALGRPPREQLRAALERSGPEARATFGRLDRGYRGFVDGFRSWIATLYAYLLERHGPDELAAAVGAEPLVDAALRARLTAADLEPDAARADAQRFAELADAGRAAEALAHFERCQARHLRWHDAYRDWLSGLLSHVYRRLGIEALEASMRYSGERTLLRWMPHDLARPPQERVRQWAALALANFSEPVRVEEDAEKFTLSMGRCGSCGRQIRDGCYGPPPRLAIVEERHPLTFGRGGVPVYRTHVAVMHYLLPIERTGVPWPVILCPEGQGDGECRMLLYKDPSRTPPEHARRVGL
jgi:hypothetical protein